MSQETLTAKVRHSSGKKITRKLRKLDKIPAILYGSGQATMLEMDEVPTRQSIEKMYGAHQLVPLQIIENDKDPVEHQVLIQEIQKHPYKRKIVHLDLRQLDADKHIILNIPLRITGVAPGIKKGGSLQLIVREVPIRCLPSNIPEYIEVDVSDLDFNETIRVQEAKYPEAISCCAKENYTIVTIIGRKAETELEQEQEEETVEEQPEE
ncbi:MAG: 50S ribosomal protein L25 [SAR324 cluster bacterium]|nr:50S ribosomal protein L25 [SAR324 cluster bacterium]